MTTSTGSADRRPRTVLAQVLDALPVLPEVRRILEYRGIRVEDGFEEDGYVLHADLPGIDPDKDLELATSRGMLHIHVQRSAADADAGGGGRHHEIRYGTARRAVRLPAGAQEDQVTASYSRGVLRVAVPMLPAKETARRITVERS